MSVHEKVFVIAAAFAGQPQGHCEISACVAFQKHAGHITLSTFTLHQAALLYIKC